MRLYRPCFPVRCIFPEALFRIKTRQKLLYLTFDDGPDPESTQRLLEILDAYGIKAMFFCSGRAAEKYPGLVKLLAAAGHIIGNHGYLHRDGWKTSLMEYTSDVALAAEHTSDLFFRPPFGRMKYDQYRMLKKKYSIILWDIMPYDFDNSFGRDNSLKVLKSKIRPGSIIVLHDKPDSAAVEILPQFLDYSLCNGYKFNTLTRT